MIDGWIPYPARKIAEQTGTNLTAARKGLQQLKKQGFVDSICVYIGANALTSEHNGFPYHGWMITEKAFQTAEYKKAAKEEKMIIEEVFGYKTEGEWE